MMVKFFPSSGSNRSTDLVEQTDNCYRTQVYVKPTNVGKCLNATSECPESYKKSVVAAYVKRALTHSTSWDEVHEELERVRQLLTNNGFRDELIVNKRITEFIKRASTTKKEQQQQQQ